MNSILLLALLSSLVLLTACGGGDSSEPEPDQPKFTTQIENLSLDIELVRGQESKVVFECEHCIKEDAIYLWVVDEAEVSTTRSFIPDFEHLDKRVFVTVLVPSIDGILSDEAVIDYEIVSRKTQIDTLELSGIHTPKSNTEAAFTCQNCMKETLSIQWLIDDVLVSDGMSFTPSLENFDKKITVKAQIDSVDKIPSEVISKDFIKPTPLSGYISGSEALVLMSNGELVFDGNSQNNRPNEQNNNFVYAFYEDGLQGTVLAEDSDGNYFEYGGRYLADSTQLESGFADVSHKISNVEQYWHDFFGRHVLTSDGRVITWNNTLDDSGTFEFSKTQLSQPELVGVKQVLHSIHNCLSNNNTSAVLYDDGLLVVDGFWGSGYDFQFQRFEKTGVSKIQPVSYDSGEPFDAIAMFDSENNIEIWTCSDDPFFYAQENGIYATGYGELTDVDRIISPPSSKSILAIKNDGSFALRGSGLTYNVTTLDTDVKVQDLLYIGWLPVLLDTEGSFHYLDASWAEFIPENNPNFTFDNLSYSVRANHSNGIIVKEDGSALLLTQENPKVLESVKSVDLVSNFMIVTDEDDKLSTYYNYDSDRELERRYFSNGLNQIEQVHNIMDVGRGYIIQTKQGQFVLVDPSVSDASRHHDKLNRVIESLD
jgi:hypothetical protein